MRFYSEILWGRQDQKESKVLQDRKVNKEFQEKTALLEQKENRDPLARRESKARQAKKERPAPLGLLGQRETLALLVRQARKDPKGIPE
ncbi:hypothetical protein BUME_00480 [[Butyribacterium] methylotrophicum]|nr:hypothetical protein BUME_00480 [[Butyribacterium] methylotrophicum]